MSTDIFTNKFKMELNNELERNRLDLRHVGQQHSNLLQHHHLSVAEVGSENMIQPGESQIQEYADCSYPGQPPSSEAQAVYTTNLHHQHNKHVGRDCPQLSCSSQSSETRSNPNKSANTNHIETAEIGSDDPEIYAGPDETSSKKNVKHQTMEKKPDMAGLNQLNPALKQVLKKTSKRKLRQNSSVSDNNVSNSLTTLKAEDNLKDVTYDTKKRKKKIAQHSNMDKQSDFGDVEILQSLVGRLDPVVLWRGIRKKITSHYNTWTLMCDICSSQNTEKTSAVPSQILQFIVDEAGAVLDELASVVEDCCTINDFSDKNDSAVDSDEAVFVENVRLKRSFGLASADQVRFKLKPLDLISSKYRENLWPTHSSDAENYQIDKEIGIKVEESLGKKSYADDLSVDENSSDQIDHGDQISFHENEDCDEQTFNKMPVDKKRKIKEYLSTKIVRPKRKSAKIEVDCPKIILEEFDEIEDDDLTEKGTNKRRKFAPKNSGPPFDCDTCGSTFDDHGTYRNHVKKCEGSLKKKKPPFIRMDKRYYCAHSDCLPLPQQTSLVGKTLIKSKIIPGDQQESWSSVTYIWRHFTETHATDDDLSFPCTYCTEKFLTRGLQKTHVYNKHELRYTCRFCGLSFALGTTLRKHERVHTGEKPFKCDHCQFRCSRSSSLRTHERRRHGVGLQLTSGDASAETGNADPSAVNGTGNGQTSGRSHVCEICGKAFFTKQTLQDHHVTHTGARPYMCPVCGKTLRNDSCLRRHMMGVHGIKQTCQLCGKDFSSKSGLQHHQRDFHGIHF